MQRGKKNLWKNRANHLHEKLQVYNCISNDVSDSSVRERERERASCFFFRAQAWSKTPNFLCIATMLLLPSPCPFHISLSTYSASPRLFPQGENTSSCSREFRFRVKKACRAIYQASAQLVVGGIVQELPASETQVKPFERSLRLDCCRSLPWAVVEVCIGYGDLRLNVRCATPGQCFMPIALPGLHPLLRSCPPLRLWSTLLFLSGSKTLNPRILSFFAFLERTEGSVRTPGWANLPLCVSSSGCLQSFWQNHGFFWAGICNPWISGCWRRWMALGIRCRWSCNGSRRVLSLSLSAHIDFFCKYGSVWKLSKNMGSHFCKINISSVKFAKEEWF
jgi:hypothetical protein